uniref:Transmembrane protein n=1 Tax=Cacopsylla melanoneura TaxID=428564 RepID=A0A8D8VYR7_9HEMI
MQTRAYGKLYEENDVILCISYVYNRNQAHNFLGKTVIRILNFIYFIIITQLLFFSSRKESRTELGLCMYISSCTYMYVFFFFRYLLTFSFQFKQDHFYLSTFS